MLAEGGPRGDLIKTVQGDKPELAKDIVMQRPPEHPRDYAAAWDRVMTSLN